MLGAWLLKNERTNRWLAEELGVAESQVGRWLSGMWRPRQETLLAIESITGIPASAWLDERKPLRTRRAA